MQQNKLNTDRENATKQVKLTWKMQQNKLNRQGKCNQTS